MSEPAHADPAHADPARADTARADTVESLTEAIHACRICAARFAATRTHHEPRPVPWLSATAPILLASQAPGVRVHETGIPFNDRSGDTLRDWLGVDRDTFYDQRCFAIVPMAFCFPGYSASGSDLPPPAICATVWRRRALAVMPQLRLTVLIGSHAQRWHLGRARPVAETVADWRATPPGMLPLPHPSWRNIAWRRRNPWFETDLLPELRARIAALLEGVA